MAFAEHPPECGFNAPKSSRQSRQRPTAYDIDSCRNQTYRHPINRLRPLVEDRDSQKRCYRGAQCGEGCAARSAEDPDSAAIKQQGDDCGEHTLDESLQSQVAPRGDGECRSWHQGKNWQIEKHGSDSAKRCGMQAIEASLPHRNRVEGPRQGGTQKEPMPDILP